MTTDPDAQIEWLNDSDWVFIPSQTRSRESLARILLSARDLFVEKGFEGTTIADISAHSGVSVGSIYHRFKDKKTIFYAVLESYRRTRFTQLDDMTTLDKWRLKSLDTLMDFHINLVFSSARQDGAFYRLIESQRMHDPLVRDMQIEWDEHVCRILGALYQLHEERIDVPNIPETIRHFHLFLRGAVLWSILSTPLGQHPLNIFSDDFPREAKALLRARLGLPCIS
jgi:AcrR family transcriptional regulator